tara:strand:+ start:79 stop:327 length:249 start_codon:yes stop_codon:yes gene_type:complete
MTKKHFEMIAKVLRNRADAINNSSASNEEKHYALFELRNTMYNFCDEFKAANPRFDVLKFKYACKVEKYFQIIREDIYQESQ